VLGLRETSIILMTMATGESLARVERSPYRDRVRRVSELDQMLAIALRDGLVRSKGGRTTRAMARRELPASELVRV
jgi:hypothetical protein